MPRIESSDIRVQTVMAGSLWLDGGAMFGVVPKTLWSRRTHADERNRIQLAMRCLLIETPAATVLVDTGLGNKDNDRFRDIYGVSNAGEPTLLESSLRELGVEPRQVDIVVNTHLHFDHAGGNTVRLPDGRIEPAFPNAVYAIQKGEWEYARLHNERVQASYVANNFVPLESDARIRWLDGERETIVPGVEVVRTPGHTPFHQSVLVTVGGERLLYLADLVPTVAHLPLAWIMGYDVEPLTTLESKRHWLGRAVSEGWLLGFEHDPSVAWGAASAGDRPGRTELKDVVEDLVNPVDTQEDA
jgi:glyoxylase-like metal-dependent hydrolase (beta-lactamase superfamily II)